MRIVRYIWLMLTVLLLGCSRTGDDAAAARGAVAGGQEPAHTGQDGRFGPEPAGVPAVFTL